MAARIPPPETPNPRGPPAPPVDGRRQTAGDDRHPAPDPAALLRALLDPVGRPAAWGPPPNPPKGPSTPRRPGPRRRRPPALHAPGLRQPPRVLLDPRGVPDDREHSRCSGGPIRPPPIGQPPMGAPRSLHALGATSSRQPDAVAGGEPPVPGAGQEFARLNPERGPAGSHIGSSPPRAPASSPASSVPTASTNTSPGSSRTRAVRRIRSRIPARGSPYPIQDPRCASSAPPRGARRRTSP
jgi:hypothetical protein